MFYKSDVFPSFYLVFVLHAQDGTSDGEEETSSIGVILHDKTRVGDSFQVKSAPY